ncbi:alpha/beta hydrolase family protein [Novispirillum itersonii]|uniref:Putative alpha/beta hydrolase n=1 Tax=Novispirillum itersonii TaxID=189 RepID=A0A7W9ZHI9_NOVIT|nr:alpha/beta fold hydrolase [Novispirillum itersonii]MBB6211581.1 putative alpha/beta hydrolase [Novispirillum itersonii]
MTQTATPPAAVEGQPVGIPCRDGVTLGGHLFRTADLTPSGSILINCATGVLARYYHRYARFLAGHGFDVLTYDYRGIGLSRPARLRGSGIRWDHWGTLDCDAALRFLDSQHRGGPLMLVGHSIGGFLPGLAPAASRLDRILTMGAQYAWCGDYAADKRAGLLLKWHLAMPLLTLLYGYFPGRRLGWLEDLPAGVARDWSFRGRRFERSHPPADRPGVLASMAAVTAPLLAVTMADDEFGTVPAITRTLAYYRGAERTMVRLSPADYGRDRIGHFTLFHDSHAAGFWADTLRWLRDGHNPWPQHSTAVIGG